MADLHIGIMSGTSLDGADAVLVDWSDMRNLAFATRPFPEELRDLLLGLSASGPDELERSGSAAQMLAEVYAEVAKDVLGIANIRASEVRSMGCHGQTVRHRPEKGFTIQLQNAALLAELTGITVVADFRSRDMAASGQGAPLAPAFHEGVFRHDSITRAVVNIGGISNITVLAPGQPVRGFDCGPGNVLMDYWTQLNLGQAFDLDGTWAASGQTNAALMKRLLSEPYFSLPPPKSTGRELFNARWLSGHLDGQNLSPADIQATLLELTCRTVAESIQAACPGCSEVIVCGGGARNTALMQRLAKLSGLNVVASDVHGIPSGQVEAMAFSWFAKQTLEGRPVALQSITGSRHPVILGAIYRA
jgi:anhydro-N-acetylmuramic acid kinase